MARIKRKKKSGVEVIGILGSDIHLRDDVPVARTDDYWTAQEAKLLHILGLSVKYDCDIFLAGDVFDKAKASQFLEQWAITIIRNNLTNVIHTVPGQHDLPSHNLNLYEKSSLRVLEAAGAVHVIPVPYDDLKRPGVFEMHNGMKITMLHTMVYEQHPIHDTVGGIKAAALLKKYKDSNIVLTGDNHMTFFYTNEKGRSLVNPGSMMRMDADQIAHSPSVFLWYADNTIERVKLPLLVKNAVTRKHIEVKEQRNNKMQSFIKRIKNDYEVGISFKKNMKAFFRKNKGKVKKPIEELTWRFINGEE